MNMIDNEFRHFQREKKKERKEGDSAVEKRVGGGVISTSSGVI